MMILPMTGDSHEYAEKMTRLITVIETAIEKEGLTNSQAIDLIAGLLLAEIMAAKMTSGQDGVTYVLERFLQRISIMPGFDFKLMETRTKK